jgi:hypothetical protein
MVFIEKPFNLYRIFCYRIIFMTSSNTTTIYSPEYANSFKYLVDIRWNLLCLFNNISMKAQLFNNLCDKYEKQICEEILVGGYSNNNSFEEISRIYYILLEEALCLENHGCIEEKSPKKMSPNVFEISNKSRLNWKDKKEYRLCSRNQLLQFFAYLSLDKVILNFVIFFFFVNFFFKR